MARADLVNQAEDALQDSTNAIWTAAEVGLKLDDAMIEASWYVPYVMKDIYTVESRTGSASSTSANNLVDATKSPFVSGDTGKVVYNVTDKTWAVITSYSSATQVGLSKDIFTSGEQYEIYNKGCWNSKQINIANSEGYLWIIGVEYPALRSPYTRRQSMRNFTLHEQQKILEIDVAYVDDSAVATADKDAYLHLARPHVLNPMTDLAGEVDFGAGYAAGSTTIHMDGLGATETIYKGALLYFGQLGGNTVDSRFVYRVTEDVTLSSNEGDVKIWPGLESALVDNDDVTFLRSTLTPELERAVVQLTAGRCAMSKSIKYINTISVGGGSSYSRYREWGQGEVAQAIRKLKTLQDPELKAYIPQGRF